MAEGHLSLSTDIGDRGPTVGELLSWVEEYPIEWQKPRFDLAGLARARVGLMVFLQKNLLQDME